MAKPVPHRLGYNGVTGVQFKDSASCISDVLDSFLVYMYNSLRFVGASTERHYATTLFSLLVQQLAFVLGLKDGGLPFV